MKQIATVVFDFQAKTLTLAGELLPETPLIHDTLVGMLFGNHESDFSVSKTESGVVSYSLVVSAAAASVPAVPKPAARTKQTAESDKSVAEQAADALSEGTKA